MREAERARIAILSEWQEKSTENHNDILFSRYMKDWLEETKHNIAENTYFSYKQTIHNCICPYFEERKIKLCDLKPYHIQEFYNTKMDADEVTGNTIRHYHANIRKALNCAVKTERIKSNPADKIELPKKQKHIANYYTLEELKILIETSKGTTLETIVLLASWLGLRRGETIGLRWDCVDFENNTISILGTVTDKEKSGSRITNLTYRTTTKTNASLRTLPMSKEVSTYLIRLKKQQDKNRCTNKYYNQKWNDFVCVRDNGDLIPLDYVSRTFPKLCKQCGLRVLKLHELRHSNISLLIEAGENMKTVQEWAGHSSYNTTANIYSHIQAKSKKELAHTLENLLR